MLIIYVCMSELEVTNVVLKWLMSYDKHEDFSKVLSECSKILIFWV